jgi:hypothetical protein
MLCEEDHPDLSLSEWKTFRRDCSPSVIEQVIDRKECKLPTWFVPRAVGAVVASPALLHRVGYLPGMDSPPDWRELRPGYFERKLRRVKLVVRNIKGTSFWTVEWLWLGSSPRPLRQLDKVLAYMYGGSDAIPILTRTPEPAMWLCEYCFDSDPPPALQWVEAVPE